VFWKKYNSNSSNRGRGVFGRNIIVIVVIEVGVFWKKYNSNSSNNAGPSGRAV